MDAVYPPEKLKVIDTLAALRTGRIKQGVSQQELAARISMKRPQIAKIERMDSTPLPATLTRYANGLGLKLKLLVTN